MRAVIDTTSLVSFVRYYLPFDKDDKLKKLFEKKFKSGEIIILDKVFEESKLVAKGIVAKELKFLADKTKLVKTDVILPFPSKPFSPPFPPLHYLTYMRDNIPLSLSYFTA